MKIFGDCKSFGIVLWFATLFYHNIHGNYYQWRSIPRLQRPSISGEMINEKNLRTDWKSVRRNIVLQHNFYRASVQPTASDMLEMSWEDQAARDAQRWANTCQLLNHDNNQGRSVPGYGPCGQNIFVSNVKVPWKFAIKVWFVEHYNFSYGGYLPNNPSLVSHYTQMVWHRTHKVGCGFNYCPPSGGPHNSGRLTLQMLGYYTYICNYCPIGNHMDRLDRPYNHGKPCSKCPRSCRYKKLCKAPLKTTTRQRFQTSVYYRRHFAWQY